MMGHAEQMDSRRGFPIKKNLKGTIVPLAVTLFSLLIGPLLDWWYQADGSTEASTARLVLPDHIGEWHPASGGMGVWRPEILGADSSDSKTYAAPGIEPVELYVFYYYRQRQGKEAISDINRVADGKEWRVEYSRQRQIANAEVETSVEETLIRSKTGKEKLVWRWYSVNGTMTDNRLAGKIRNIIGTLAGDPSITVVVVAAEHQEYGRSSEALTSFVAQNLGNINEVIRGIRQQ